MKNIFAKLLIAVCCLNLTVAATAQKRASSKPAGGKQPNVVVILADDLGYSDVGAYGGELETPNLDRLAAEGMRFTDFYNTPRCCPTRASLLTGLYPQQTGVGWLVDQPIQPGNYTRRLNDSCVTIAEALRPAGYRTILSGKWHVGEDAGSRPEDRGFERSFALLNALSNYFGVYGSYPTNDFVQGAMRRIERIERQGIWSLEGKPFTPPEKEFYSTQAVTDYAVKTLDEGKNDKKPFFLYLSYPAPHWALQALPEDIAKHRSRYLAGWDAARRGRYERLVKLGLINRNWTLPPRDERVPAWEAAGDLAAWSEPMRFYPRSDGTAPWDRADNRERWALKMAVHAAMIDRMDQGIGQILAKLKEIGADDNTLVLFLSDNGASSERIDRGVPGVEPGPADSFLSFGVPWAQVSNTPFRNYKARVYEGGISTPLIARWRSRIQPNSINRRPGHVMDIMATVLEAASVKYPATYKKHEVLPLEGKSLLPAFAGNQKAQHEILFWEHEGNRAVRQGKWKLVADYNRPWELYDLEADRTEQRNLATANPAKVKELSAAYDAWAKRSNVASWDEWTRRKQ